MAPLISTKLLHFQGISIGSPRSVEKSTKNKPNIGCIGLCEYLVRVRIFVRCDLCAPIEGFKKKEMSFVAMCSVKKGCSCKMCRCERFCLQEKPIRVHCGMHGKVHGNYSHKYSLYHVFIVTGKLCPPPVSDSRATNIFRQRE
jgi:hypothetical protein